MRIFQNYFGLVENDKTNQSSLLLSLGVDHTDHNTTADGSSLIIVELKLIN